MRIIFYSLSIIFLLFSCHSKKVKNNETIVSFKDSIVEVPTQSIDQDYPKFTRQDSIELHAIADLYFGKLQRDSSKPLEINELKYTLLVTSPSTYKFGFSAYNTFYGQKDIVTMTEANDVVNKISSVIRIKYGEPKEISNTLVWSTKFKTITLSIDKWVNNDPLLGGNKIYVYMIIENINLKKIEVAQRAEEEKKRLENESSKF
jgi:hypothetical protein